MDLTYSYVTNCNTFRYTLKSVKSLPEPYNVHKCCIDIQKNPAKNKLCARIVISQP